MASSEVWKDSFGLGHCSFEATDDMEADKATAVALINLMGIATEFPIRFERFTNHGTVVYGHSMV